MSGKRTLKDAATPLPITPTQLTVFTHVCIFDANRSPISTFIMTGPRSLEKQVGVDHDIALRGSFPKHLRRVRTRYICPQYVLWINSLGYEHLGTSYRLSTPFLNLILVGPVPR